MSKKKFAKRQVGEAVSVTVARKQTEPIATGLNSQTNWFVLLLIILPFVISREAIDPTITIRYLLLSIFIFAFTLYFYVYRKELLLFNLPKIQLAIFVCGIIFCLWSLVSVSFSINKPAGYNEVLRYFLNFVFLFLVMQMVYKEKTQVLKIFKTLVIVALLHSFVGIFQYYELAFNELPGANAKPYGLMANRNLFASAQVLLLPFIVYVACRTQGFWRAASICSGLLTVFSILLSQTRSAWVAALVILVGALLLVVIFMPSTRKRWLIGTVLVGIVIAAFAGLLVVSDSEGVISKSLSERALSLTEGTSGSNESATNSRERVAIWRKTQSLIADNPLFGTGPANWKLMIASYGTDGLHWSLGTFVPDSPHNVYLQLAAETGLPGVALYLAVFILIAIVGIKSLKKLPEGDRLLPILMLTGLASFASDSMFSFPADRIEHSVYLFLMCGIIMGIYRSTQTVTTAPRRTLHKASYIFLVIAAGNIFLAAKRHQFEIHLNYAKGYEKAGRYEELIEEAKKGKNSFVNIDMVGTSLETKASTGYNELKDYPQALKEINRAAKLHPHSPMVYNNMGTIYTNMNDFPKAIECYNKALLYASNYDIVLKNLAVNYFRVGNYNECINALKKVKVEEDPYLVDLMASAKQMAGDSTRRQ